MGNAPSYKGCKIPEDLYYDLEYHVWVKVDGEIAFIGATDPAQAYAGEIIYLKVKGRGTKVPRGGILATVESAKYMGPMRSPLSGVVVETNGEVVSNPSLVNRDPYASWVVCLKPDNLDGEIGLLTKGKEASERYKKIIDEWGIQCR
ncbi:MAG: glycine cleavage system protein H [Thaumarchaeota archaeon]|nr:glycine cleavage system protein H [Candidatus Calditenuaceae archaeon]MDW8041564.1 glycine cleavage system protein H [Nitrososphaerota archaeon]